VGGLILSIENDTTPSITHDTCILFVRKALRDRAPKRLPIATCYNTFFLAYFIGVNARHSRKPG